MDEHDIDFRVPGLSHAVVKEAEYLRVQELVKKIENHPRGEAFHADLPKNNVYNPLSIQFEAMIRELGNVELANGEVQTHEEATVYVKELDVFLTMKVLEDTPAVLSLGKLCDEHGYSYEWINGQKPHLIKNGIRIQCNTENFVPIVVLGLSTSSSSSLPSSTPMTPFKAGN